jgi:hypothetical protein
MPKKFHKTFYFTKISTLLVKTFMIYQTYVVQFSIPKQREFKKIKRIPKNQEMKFWSSTSH